MGWLSLQNMYAQIFVSRIFRHFLRFRTYCRIQVQQKMSSRSKQINTTKTKQNCLSSAVRIPTFNLFNLNFYFFKLILKCISNARTVKICFETNCMDNFLFAVKHLTSCLRGSKKVKEKMYIAYVVQHDIKLFQQ